jgi:hypothetical protein
VNGGVGARANRVGGRGSAQSCSLSSSSVFGYYEENRHHLLSILANLIDPQPKTKDDDVEEYEYEDEMLNTYRR